MVFYIPDLNEKGFIEAGCKIKGNQFYFVFRWNNYCDCAFVKILDAERNILLDDTALQVGLVIRLDERVLPMLQFKGKEYPPLKETIKDYYIEWEE